MALYGHSGAVTCLDVQGDTLVSGAKDRSVKGERPPRRVTPRPRRGYM